MKSCVSKLEEKLGVPTSSELYNYILNIGEEHDLREYLHGLLGDSSPGYGPFVENFVKEWRLARSKLASGQRPASGTITIDGQEHRVLRKSTSQKKAQDTGPKGGAGGKAGKRSNHTPPKTEAIELASQKTPTGGTKPRTRYTPLYSKDGHDQLVVKLPGRNRCECQATKHSLVNNCLTCGRIVCSQEGSGPCYFCGSLVCTNEEWDIVNSNSKSGQQLRQKLMGRNTDKPQAVVAKSSGHVENHGALEKVTQHKNRLLEFDRTVERRTKVIDDQSDYFTVDNRWLSMEERDVLRKHADEQEERRQKARHTTKVTFDFAGRIVVEEKENFEDIVVNEAVFQRLTSKGSEKDSNVGYGPNTYDLPKPKYLPSGIEGARGTVRGTPITDALVKGMRLQDSELQEMSDEGRCLSLHQPYASLLVTGLKRHEGRSWYTPFRGRLWIASAAKEPTTQDVREVENTIRAFCNDETLRFPSSYPTSALLGCVTITDCIPQEEYREKFPDGESESPYVFICENPHVLTTKFPIKGQHKIFALDANIHHAAKKMLRSVQQPSQAAK